ncbi:MAG TPA: hypothetical protein VHC22_12100 [Pirellulales bacterium]|nr:hypothetical protein [Pirellulales bacterium]
MRLPRWQFGVRTMLIAITALMIWLGWQAERIHRQRAAVAVIDRLHGSVEYRDAVPWPAVSRRLAACLGRDAVANVAAVYLGGTSAGDDELACLHALPRLRVLVLTSSAVTDAGLPHLHALREVESIDLRFTAVTDAGVARLRRALPHTRVLGKSDIE